ncbi:FecR domain-containing protein [Novosphingobium sp. YJ-S2-02]|uniref:FecR domain-containing protein n=1 Tax=Novosphingobium aureum TaxID=2792964 RepID=A0A931H9E8_9SPHN|nr:FecR domain-containing protein [Novosphingobium aureum]MBH0111438.1 FecR domain-containing protein [Novosphingobium aureum]
MTAQTTADDTAAFWYARLGADDLHAADREAFETWLESDTENRRAWLRVERAALAADTLAVSPEARALVADALASPARDRAPLRKKRAPVLAMAAAAVLTLGIGSITWLNYATGEDTPAAATQTFASAAGEKREFMLEDGSKVVLDAASEVKVAANSGGRTLELTRGEAYFTVAKDREHPFTVTAAGYTVTALGTQFDVDLAGHGSGLKVALIEGKVGITREQDEESWILTPGMVLSVAGDEVRLSEKSAAQAVGWMSGTITFDNAPLGEVVARMNRYLPHRLTIDPRLEKRSFSGLVRTDDDAALIEALEAYGIARARKRDDGVVELVPY